MRIKINISFILFLFISTLLGYWKVMLIIFISILLHELGHSIVAKVLGIKVWEIQIFPFGAIAIMENITKYGGFEELIIAVSGPIVSLLIAIAFLYFKNDTGAIFFKYNIALFLFNLVPVLPLDGGRALRSILLLRLSYKKSTKILTNLGKLVAIIIVFYNIYLIANGVITIIYAVTAIFIFIGTTKEEKNCSYVYMLSRNSKKEKLLKKRGFKTRVLKGSKGTNLKSIIDQFSPRSVCRVEVYNENGDIIKVLSEADVMDGFLIKGYYSKIGDII